MADKKFTWNDLVDVIISLSPEERHKQAKILIADDEATTPISGYEIVEEDIYCPIGDNEGCGTLKELKELHGDEFREQNFELRTSKGSFFLYQSF